MASSNATVRHASREDVPTILALIQELALYENASDKVDSTEEILTRTLAHYDPSTSTFSEGFARTLLLTDPDGTVAGMALYFYNYSTWTGVPGIYLEDLFVKENYRKKGYGKRLLKELAGEVLKVGGKRLEWSCLTWNEPSLQFYQSEAVGAQTKDAWNFGIHRDVSEDVEEAVEANNLAVCRTIGLAMHKKLPRELRDMVYAYLTTLELELSDKPDLHSRKEFSQRVQQPKCMEGTAKPPRYTTYFALQPHSKNDGLCSEHYWRDDVVSSKVASEPIESWYRNSTFYMNYTTMDHAESDK
ncbi:unnamed protein product [Alternaria sp. RS040]